MAQDIPSSNNIPPPPGMSISDFGPPDDLDPPTAFYKIDNYSEQRAIEVGLKMTEEGVISICEFNPIPSDAKKMTYIIEKFGVWEGPWEFEIQLS